MSIIQKSDRYTEILAKLGEMIFSSKDIIDTMRFTELDGVEEFSNSMAFGNARSWLYTGVSQCQRMAEALQQWKTDHADQFPDYKPESKQAEKDEHDDGKKEWWRDANYNPKVVQDFLTKWNLYDTNEGPENPRNMVIILNYLWRYNRNLMWVVHVFFPIHLAVLNGRYARGSRTFKAYIEMAKNMYQRELETNIGRRDSAGRSWRHPLGQKDSDSS